MKALEVIPDHSPLPVPANELFPRAGHTRGRHLEPQAVPVEPSFLPPSLTLILTATAPTQPPSSSPCRAVSKNHNADEHNRLRCPSRSTFKTALLQLKSWLPKTPLLPIASIHSPSNSLTRCALTRLKLKLLSALEYALPTPVYPPAYRQERAEALREPLPALRLLCDRCPVFYTNTSVDFYHSNGQHSRDKVIALY